MKQRLEDFQVEEILGFELSDSGEFIWLQIEKSAANTRWIAKRIAEFADVSVKTVGYGGLKDRQAITRQWFSIPIGKKNEPDWSGLESDELTILQVSRHHSRLRRGDHAANRFVIRLRDFSADPGHCDRLLTAIKQQGFPNYFGQQRFGNDGGNLTAARDWFAGEIHPKRAEQGFYLSAVRSLLFNQVLARRVEQGNWCSALPGDLMESAETGHCFPLPRPDEKVFARCRKGELSPTGPLYGSGEPKAGGQAGELEMAVFAEQSEWVKGLDRQRMRADRRPLRCLPTGLEWSLEPNLLHIAFELPTGAYATALLRELASW